jgi:dihydroneopterin aldolase
LHFETEASRLNVREYFDRVYVGVPDKTEKIGEILHENRLNADETIFAGDMLHDIETGRRGGVLSVAVCTGFDSDEKLAGSLPDLMVRNLSALQRVMDAKESGRGAIAEDEWIEIVDQEVFCRIGVPDDERSMPQRLLMTIRFKIALPFRALNDRFEHTIDYAAVAAEVDRIASSTEMKLAESLVTTIADQLLARFPMLEVQVSVKKFILPNSRWIEVGTQRRTR